MRLLKLKLRDFQAHDALEVAFSGGLTTIVGPSDAGKSAILRALRWTCLNDLSGDEFIREGAKRTCVTLETDAGVVRRTKGLVESGFNVYELGDKEYRSFSQGVPDDIARVLNLTDLNFQGQHDSPFWFADTAGEVSRKLNAVVDLSVIDETLSTIATEVRRAQERRTISKERLAGLQEELSAVADQQDRVQAFQTLKERHEEFTKSDQACHRLGDLIQRLRDCRHQKTTAEEKLFGLEEVLAAAVAVRMQATACRQLAELINQIERNQAAAAMPPDFTPVSVAYVEWQSQEDEVEHLNLLIGSAVRAQATMEQKAAAAESADEQFHRRIKGANCPLCGAKIDP